MLHLPAEHPRGLLKKVRQVKTDSSWVLIYAYPFFGTHLLAITPTVSGRPREKVPDAMYQVIRPQLQYLGDYERKHGKGSGARNMPVFDMSTGALVTGKLYTRR